MSIALVAVALSFFSSLAHAQTPSPATLSPSQFNQSEYESVLAQALSFHAQGDYEAARAFMERAHKLEPSARTLRGLGIVAFAQNQHLAAIRYLDQALASDVKALPGDLRTSVEQLREQSWAQLGRFTLHVEPPSAAILIDGHSPDFYASNVLALEPGSHTVRVSAEKHITYNLTLVVSAGAREGLHIVLSPEAVQVVVEKVVSAPAPVAIKAQGTEPLPRWSPALRYAGIGAGVAVVLGGAALWTTGRIRLNQIIDACEQTPTGACSRTEARRRYTDKQVEPLFVSSAVLVGTGAAMLIAVSAIEIYRHRQRDLAVRVAVGPSSLALGGEF